VNTFYLCELLESDSRILSVVILCESILNLLVLSGCLRVRKMQLLTHRGRIMMDRDSLMMNGNTVGTDVR
jgi:hypothetical protein